MLKNYEEVRVSLAHDDLATAERLAANMAREFLWERLARIAAREFSENSYVAAPGKRAKESIR